MYHYRECGLPNVYLVNGYREVRTPHGQGVAIEDVRGLHEAIARSLVSTRSTLGGAEVRFIRKFLDLTQRRLADLLGVEEQSVRRWEALATLPRAAERAARLVFRELLREESPPLLELIERISGTRRPSREKYRHRARGWHPEKIAA